MPTLAETLANYVVVDHAYVGRQVVPLSQIRGSVTPARSHDFDASFRLLRNHDRARWQSILAARRRGVRLPPVTLIQLGAIYFIEDGHHRVSVARAEERPDIEAEVTVLQVAEAPAWEGTR
ncbi:MAG: hypothetical protein IAE79_03895 [Anaerolinea sp.]|nr:hypothetical protein [Anaerolinea sp.]